MSTQRSTLILSSQEFLSGFSGIHQADLPERCRHLEIENDQLKKDYRAKEHELATEKALHDQRMQIM